MALLWVLSIYFPKLYVCVSSSMKSSSSHTSYFYSAVVWRGIFVVCCCNYYIACREVKVEDVIFHLTDHKSVHHEPLLTFTCLFKGTHIHTLLINCLLVRQEEDSHHHHTILGVSFPLLLLSRLSLCLCLFLPIFLLKLTNLLQSLLLLLLLLLHCNVKQLPEDEEKRT